MAIRYTHVRVAWYETSLRGAILPRLRDALLLSSSHHITARAHALISFGTHPVHPRQPSHTPPPTYPSVTTIPARHRSNEQPTPPPSPQESSCTVPNADSRETLPGAFCTPTQPAPAHFPYVRSSWRSIRMYRVVRQVHRPREIDARERPVDVKLDVFFFFYRGNWNTNVLQGSRGFLRQ